MSDSLKIASEFTNISWQKFVKNETDKKSEIKPYSLFTDTSSVGFAKQMHNKIIDFANNLIQQNINEFDNSYLILTQGRKEQWCADTVNYLYEKSIGETPFGLKPKGKYKAAVAELKSWGIDSKRYKPLGNNDIHKQITELKAGDVIIFKSPYEATVDGGKKIIKNASHTGIVESVSENIVTIIEGNANIVKRNEKGEFLLVKTTEEAQNGAQSIGEFQEVNPSDSLLKKKYCAQDLISSGYSGYIDMSDFQQFIYK